MLDWFWNDNTLFDVIVSFVTVNRISFKIQLDKAGQ